MALRFAVEEDAGTPFPIRLNGHPLPALALSRDGHTLSLSASEFFELGAGDVLSIG